MFRRALPIVAIFIIALGLWQVIGQGSIWPLSPPRSAPDPAPDAGSGSELDTHAGQVVLPSEQAIRMAAPFERVVKLSASSGSRSVYGTAHWITLSDPLIDALQTQPLISPSEIRRLGGHRQQSFDESGFPVEFPPGEAVFFWVECPGYRPASCFVEPLEEVPNLSLEPCSIFEVEVLDPTSAPLLATNVVITRKAKDDAYLSLDWRARLERRYFQQTAATDHVGIALFDVLPDDKLFVWVSPRPPYGLITRDEQTPMGKLTVHAHASATVYGQVRSESGEGMADVYIGVMHADRFGIRTSVGDANSEADGSYRAEQVTASGEGLVAIAYAEGYETQTAPLPFLRPGQEHRIDFTLRKASARSFHVVSPSGQALTGLKLEFAEGPYDWIPFAATVDENGIAETKPILVDDSEYFVRVYSADTRVYQTTVQTKKSSDIVEIVIPHLGRFRGENREVTGYEALEVTPQGNGTRSFYFENADVSPWLPAGPAVLQRVDRDGTVSPIVSLNVLEGEQPWPALHAAFPHLQFSLELLPEEKVQLVVVGAGSIEQTLGEVKPGANSFSIPAPGLESRLISDLRGSWALGSLCTGGRDQDLGQLSWPGTASFRVIVRGPDQISLPNTAVQIFTRVGAFLLSQRTDKHGITEFQGLAPGAYWVRVSPRDGHGAPLPPQLREVVLQAGTEFELHARFQSSQGIELAVPRGNGVWHAELVTDEVILRESSDAAGVIHFPLSSGGGDIHLWSTSHGQICALGVSASELDQRIEFVLPPALSIQIDSEETGAVRLLAGSRILAQVPVEARSEFRLSADTVGGLYLQWIGSRHHGERVALEQVLSERRLASASEDEPSQLSVQDELGRPVSGVQLLVVDPAASTLGDARGRVALEADWLGSPFHVQRPGFHPIRGELRPNTDLILRRLSGALRVEGVPSAEYVRVYPQFPLSVPIEQDLARMSASGSADFESLPAGPYRAEWLSDSGAVLAEAEFSLEAIIDQSLRADR